MTSILDKPTTETLFLIKLKFSCWYIDFDRGTSIYYVFKDERQRFHTTVFGEALEYVFDRLPSHSLQAII